LNTIVAVFMTIFCLLFSIFVACHIYYISLFKKALAETADPEKKIVNVLEIGPE